MVEEKWQTIETVPDDRLVMLFSPYGFEGDQMPVITVGRYSPESYHPWRVDDGRKLPKLWIIPTHWMPLPPPPAKKD